jgi:hypothetical protein
MSTGKIVHHVFRNPELCELYEVMTLERPEAIELFFFLIIDLSKKIIIKYL